MSVGKLRDPKPSTDGNHDNPFRGTYQAPSPSEPDTTRGREGLGAKWLKYLCTNSNMSKMS